jgi:hypothetical protein
MPAKDFIIFGYSSICIEFIKRRKHAEAGGRESMLGA